MKLKLYSDGAARGNPGHSAIGVVINDFEGELLEEFGEYIGEATNNEAEYAALFSGVTAAKKYVPCSLEVFMDSELLVRQMSGQYKVKNENLKIYHNNVRAELKYFEKVVFRHIPREKNARADELANIAMDKALKSGNPTGNNLKKRTKQLDLF